MTAVAREPSRWSIYRNTSPSHESIVILATNMLDAVAMAIEYRRLRGIDEVKLTIDPNWASSLSGVGRQHLEDAREICRQTSIATLYRADTGWALGGPELGLEED